MLLSCLQILFSLLYDIQSLGFQPLVNILPSLPVCCFSLGWFSENQLIQSRKTNSSFSFGDLKCCACLYTAQSRWVGGRKNRWSMLRRRKWESLIFLWSQALVVIVHLLSSLQSPSRFSLCPLCFSSLCISFKIVSVTLRVVNLEWTLTRLLQMLSTTNSKL